MTDNGGTIRNTVAVLPTRMVLRQRDTGSLRRVPWRDGVNHAVTALPVAAGGAALRQAPWREVEPAAKRQSTIRSAVPLAVEGTALQQAPWTGVAEAVVTVLSAAAAKAADRQGRQATVVCPAVRAPVAAVSVGEDQEAAAVPAVDATRGGGGRGGGRR